MSTEKPNASNVASFIEYKRRSDSFENELFQALRVDVPNNLATNLKDIPNRVPERTRRPAIIGSMVAGLSCLLLVGSLLFNSTPTAHADNLIDTAYNHMMTQKSFTDTISNEVEIGEVNNKLEPFGVEIEELPWKVRYVNHCYFKSKAVFQMITMLDSGQRVSIYLIPNAASKGKADNADKGVEINLESGAAVVAVSESRELSKQVLKEFSGNIS
ncbi:DUF3379 family protein [Vibrio paucivorans]